MRAKKMYLRSRGCSVLEGGKVIRDVSDDSGTIYAFVI